MMEEDNQQQNIPLLCRKNCGFYGSPNFDGLCSKCHRSAQAQLSVQQAECIAPALEARLTMNDSRKSPELSAESKRERKTPSPALGKKASQTRSSESLSGAVEEILSQSVPSRSYLQPESPGDQEPSTGSSRSESLSDVTKEGDKRDSGAPLKSPRCQMCRKRVGPAGGYSCRCGGLFCSLHRYSDSHDCSFDYRKAGQEDIRRSNPQIICSKLPKI